MKVMAKRLYRVKTADWQPLIVPIRSSATEHVGTLDHACRFLVRMYGSDAPVKVIAPGRYDIANGAAEMEALS